jgi:hypothetical protein
MSQQCAVCGQTYGMTHACPGAAANQSAYAIAEAWVAPAGLAPFYYLRQAIAIARFDDTAITAASRDSAALIYGVIFWLAARLLIYGVMFQIPIRAQEVSLARIAMVIAISVVIDAATILAQYGVSHGLAKWWFDARGTYIGILRPMLLGSLVLCTYVIPYVGPLVAGIWMLAILMSVFEVVDGIERMKAFALAFGFGLIFFILTFEIAAARR